MVECVIDLLYVVLNAGFILWLEHYLNGHCETVFPFYLLSIAVQCHLLAERTCRGKHVFLLHGLFKSFVSVACVGILQ